MVERAEVELGGGVAPAPVVAAIGLGANLGDREAQLASALRALERTPGVVLLRRSRWIETAPEGGPPGQGPYLNGAALVETRLRPEELLGELLRIERKLGRERREGERNAPRRIDLDLLLHGDERLSGEALTVPHPRMVGRRFVLEPLAELCPERIVPGTDRTVEQCLRDLPEAPRPDALVRLDSPAAAREWCAAVRAQGLSLGFVPTMGALHEGHLELVRRALVDNDRACVSIFVNPLQFDEARDFEDYARDFEGDAARLAAVGCSMVFTGTPVQFFPELSASGELPRHARVAPGPAALGLEGEFRPGHFEGVATIVERLFDVVQPGTAYFGQKDYQQSLVVADLARRRGAPRIVVCPTVREPSGLALSSRNRRLDETGRARALAIPRALRAARAAWEAGERRAPQLGQVMRAELENSGLEVEYADVRDPGAWSAATPDSLLERGVALIAARAGAVRLIDNHDLDLPLGPAGDRPGSSDAP